MTRRLPLATFLDDRYAAEQYNDLYSGAAGALMNISHRLLERGISPGQNRTVLEVGGGAMPHFNWMNVAETTRYVVSDIARLHQKKFAALRERAPKHIDLALHDAEHDESLVNLEGSFSRIIASHVLEHINDAEGAIATWSDRLTSDGVLSIALPCDPGWFWRFGQFVRWRTLKDFTETFEEYDLLMSREHVTSVQRVLKIVRYYFRHPRARWFPSLVPVVDFNLICAIDLRASDRR